jgi:hypothetical protein
MERMKELTSVLEPDVRNLSMVKMDRASGVVSPMTIDDHYSLVARVELHAGVPDDVRSYFETVKTLLVYGWLYYPFFAMSHINVALAVEMALRNRMPKVGKDRRGLADLFEEAEKAGVIAKSDFNSEPFRLLRNSFVHAKRPTILPDNYAIDMLAISGKLINLLWPKP